MVVTFPFLHTLGTDDDFAEVRQKLARLWSDWDVPHLDLTSVFEGLTEKDLVVNSFDMHPNALAHGMAAEAILAFVDANRREAENRQDSGAATDRSR